MGSQNGFDSHSQVDSILNQPMNSGPALRPARRALTPGRAGLLPLGGELSLLGRQIGIQLGLGWEGPKVGLLMEKTRKTHMGSASWDKTSQHGRLASGFPLYQPPFSKKTLLSVTMLMELRPGFGACAKACSLGGVAACTEQAGEERQ